jgi:hypothetical protein
MAAEIQGVDLSNPRSTAPSARNDSNEKDIAQTDTLDIQSDPSLERGVDTDENKVPIYRPEKTELTAQEAFQWNVDGDQSPCE